MSLLTKVDQRSYGETTKLYTWYAQGLSSLVFIGLSFFLPKDSPFFILFLFEGIGQIFLALQNKSSLDKGDLQVSYFKKSVLSNLALISFTIVVGARFFMMSSFLPESDFALMSLGVFSVLVWYFLFFKSSLRPDFLSGTFIVLSSFMIGGLYLTLSSELLIGISFISYSVLIILGTVLIKPWIAEFINIIVWIHLFILVISL